MPNSSAILTPATKPVKLAWFALLIAGGLIGNYLNYPIFLNIDFLFGSIFAFLALNLFGIRLGVVAAALIASYTFVLWNHPYAIVIMSAEVAVVGWLSKRRNINLVLADLLYWLVIGMPLVYIFYRLVMNVPASSVSITMTKQAVNGICNALVAQLLFAAITFRHRPVLTSYRELVYNLLTAFVLFPTLLTMMISSREDFLDTDSRIKQSLTENGTHESLQLNTWLAERTRSIATLADLAAVTSSAAMQPYLEQTVRSDANVLAIGLFDRNAQVAAIAVPGNDQAKSRITMSTAVSPYLENLKETEKPLLADIAVGDGKTATRKVALLAPVTTANGTGGYVAGILNLGPVREHLDRSMEVVGTLYTLLDSKGTVIMTNRTDQVAMTPFARNHGVIRKLDGRISQWIPDLPHNTPMSERWKKSLYTIEVPIDTAGEWRLLLEQPVAPYQKVLFESYSKRLAFLLIVLIIAQLLAEIITRGVVISLEKLNLITTHIPQQIMADSEIVWPESRIQEVNRQIENFRETVDFLHQQFMALRDMNAQLEDRVAERTIALQASEEKHRSIIMTAMDGFWLIDLQGKLLEVNEAYCRMSGYSERELMTMRVGDLDLADTPVSRDLYIQQLLQKGEDRFETLHRRKDGSVFPVEVSTQFKSAHGESIVVFLRDISQIKRANALKEAQFHLVQYSLEHSLEEFIEESLNEIEEITDSRIGFFLRVDNDRKRLTLENCSTRAKACCTPKAETSPHDDFDTAGVLADCVNLRNPIIHNDYAPVTNILKIAADHTPPSRELIVPIFRGATIKAFVVIGNKPQGYDHQDSETVSLIADLIWEVIERKQAKAALIKNKERLEYLVASSPAVIYTAEIANDFTATFISNNVEKMLGYQPGEFLADTGFWLQQLHPEDRPFVRNEMEILRQQGEYIREYRFKNRDGYYVWIHDSMLAARDTDGSLREIIGSWIDITPIKKMETRLLEGENRFRQVVESVEEFIWEIDTEGLYLYANSVVERMFGYLPEELVGKVHFYDLFVDDERQSLKERSFAIINRHNDFKAFRNRSVRKDGKIIVVETSGTPVFDATGCLLGYRGTDIDITERITLEQQLIQAQKMEAIGQLAGGIAHDFNNLLQVINTCSYLIQRELSTKGIATELVDEICKAGKRGAELTNGLLAFSRKQCLVPKKLDLNLAIANSSKFMSRLLTENISFSISSLADNLYIFADEGQLNQVLLNLITNARDAMPNGGSLRISTNRAIIDREFISTHGFGEPGNYATVTIADTGSGIPAEDQEHIFEPFFTTKGAGKGTGLGLSIVYGIIKQHRGYILMQSEPGNGTTFSAYFPEFAENIAEIEAPAEQKSPGIHHDTILVVEDNAEVRTAIISILQHHGFKTIEAGDGETAITILAEQGAKIRLVTLDLIMPGQQVQVTLRQLRQLRPKLPVIFLTGYADRSDLGQELMDSSSALLMKPVEPHRLTSTIMRLLESTG